LLLTIIILGVDLLLQS